MVSVCTDDSRSTSPFYDISGFFCVNKDGSCELLNTKLNNVSRSEQFGMFWTEDLTLVNPIRVTVGVPKSCKALIFIDDTLEDVSKLCNFSLTEFIVVKKGTKEPLSLTNTFTEDTELSLCHEIVFRGVNRNDTVVHGTSLGNVVIAKDLVPPRFHLIDDRGQECNENTTVVRNMIVDVVEWFMVTASGLVNHSEFVPPRATLGTVDALRPYFKPEFAVVDARINRMILSETTPVEGNMSVAVKKLSRLELELELELDGSDTGSETRDRLEEAIRDLVDGAVGDIEVVGDGNTFVVRITLVDDRDRDEIKNTLFSCTTTTTTTNDNNNRNNN